MIVPMKKVTIIIQSKDAGGTIEKLCSIGVLHLEHHRPPQSKDIASTKEEIAIVSDAIGILSEAEFKSDLKAQDAKDWRSYSRQIVGFHKKLDELHEDSLEILDEISRWESWGDFDPSAIEDLAKRNIFIKLYQIPAKHLKTLPSGAIVKKISAAKGMVNCVVILREKIDVGFKEVVPPKAGLNQMRNALTETKRTAQQIRKEIIKFSAYKQSLLKAKTKLEKTLEFCEALNGMGEADGLVYLTGYAPYDKTENILAASKKEKWGLLMSEPSEDDAVPTLIRNPRWVSVIEPVFKVIEVFPGYRELDISPLFLIFLSVFFGIIIGDAGYGIIFFMLTLFSQKKWGRSLGDQSMFTLFYLLSSCAIVWGALSGAFFGQEWLKGFFKPLVPALQEDRTVQIICFFLGAFHLSIGHIWRAILKSPSLAAVADIGWVFILWTSFFLAKTFIIGDPFPALGKWLIIAGTVLVVFFTSPRRNIFKGAAIGLGNLFLNLMASFTDVVSYVRLFAVGLAGVAVADTFNRMASDIGYSSPMMAMMACLVIGIGHMLNLLLGPMSVLVHGVRLNVLEFCNHADIKWSGFPYKPLK